MWFSRTNNGFRGWFAAIGSTGALATGLPSSDFNVTVRDGNDVSSSISTVTESGKPGLYRFDVSSSFFLTHGTGSYGVVIEVTNGTLNDVLSNVLTVSQNDFDTLASSSVSLAPASITTIVSSTWDAGMSGHDLPGSAGALLLSASAVSASIDYQVIANHVWDEQVSAHQTSGSSGFTLSQVSGSVGRVYDHVYGRWKIDTSLNQMIIYAPDNVTVLASYNLFDQNGVPTSQSPFDKQKA